MSEAQTELRSPGQDSQQKGTESPVAPQDIEKTAVPASGRRAAFRDVRRQLSDSELCSPGVQKLLLDILEEAERDRDQLAPYAERYHEADKRAAILLEKLQTSNAIEVFFGVGVGLGGTIIGLAPTFYTVKTEYGVITAVVGLAVTVGSTIGRLAKR
jgi:hypothetical protein